VDHKRTAKRKTEHRKARKKSTRKEKKIKKQRTIRKDSTLQRSRDKQKKINAKTLKSVDKQFNREIGAAEFKEIEEKPKKEKPRKEKYEETVKDELVIASLPDPATETPEESPQVKLSRFSKNITNLKTEIKNSRGNPGILLAKLGNAYLEAQRFMDSQTDAEERQKLLDLSNNEGLVLGSYEQAAWAYKLALSFNRKNAKTHLKIGKIYDEMKDGRNALMYAKLAHQIFKRNHNSSQLEETQSFIDLLTTKYKAL